MSFRLPWTLPVRSSAGSARTRISGRFAAGAGVGRYCESASNLDPWRNLCNPLRLNDFRRGGPSWAPIEHARNEQFRFCFNDLMLNRVGSKLDAGSQSYFGPVQWKRVAAAIYCLCFRGTFVERAQSDQAVCVG